jgi:hypothetical protein
MDDRVAVVGLIWFTSFTFAGDQIGRLLFSMPGTGASLGFIFALVSLLAWPFIMPTALENWMHDASD